MEEKFNELFARMAAHEFLLEIMMANEFAKSDNPKTNWQLFTGEILDSFRNHRGQAETDPAAELRSQAENIIDNFLLKTEMRLNSVLEIKEKADTTPTYESDV